METFSTLLALCAGNSPVSGEFLAQRPVTRSFDVFFDLHLNKRLSNREAGDLRRYRAHCDVTVMDHGNDSGCADTLAVAYARLFMGILSGRSIKLISPWTKWPPFRRRYFQIFSLDNGLAPNRRHATILTNADPIHWRIYAVLRGDEF